MPVNSVPIAQLTDASAVSAVSAVRAGQVLTADDQSRRQKLGSNLDTTDPAKWGKITGSVANQESTAEQVLGGLREVSAAAN